MPKTKPAAPNSQAPISNTREEQAGSTETVRFYISCHKPCMTIENEILRPVPKKTALWRPMPTNTANY